MEDIDREIGDIHKEFRDRGFATPAGRLTDEAFRSDDARQLAERYRDVLNERVRQADFSVGDERTPVFYSGGYTDETGEVINHERALEYCDSNPRAALIDRTEGGEWLRGQRLYDANNPLRVLDSDGPNRGGNRAEARELWSHGSERFTSGVATPGRHCIAFVRGSDPGGVYRSTERPILVRGGVDLDER